MHTPTPWEAQDNYDNLDGQEKPGQFNIRSADGWNIARVWASGPNPAVDAAYIVKACNMHEELLATVRSLIPLAVHTSPLDVSVAIARNLLAKANE